MGCNLFFIICRYFATTTTDRVIFGKKKGTETSESKTRGPTTISVPFPAVVIYVSDLIVEL